MPNEFEPITTQEAFDQAIKKRLEQKETQIKKAYEGYTSPEELEKIKNASQAQIDQLTQKVAEYEKVKGELETKIAGYETDSVKTRVAIETGIPLDLKDRIKGTTEEEIRKDAESLKSYFAKSAPTAPLSTEEVVSTKPQNIADIATTQAYKSLLTKMHGEE